MGGIVKVGRKVEEATITWNAGFTLVMQFGENENYQRLLAIDVAIIGFFWAQITTCQSSVAGQQVDLTGQRIIASWNASIHLKNKHRLLHTV